MTKKEITPEYMAELAMYAIVSSRCYVQTAKKYGVTVSDITFWVNIIKRNVASLYSEENLKSESGMQTKAISDSETEMRRRNTILNDRKKRIHRMFLRLQKKECPPTTSQKWRQNLHGPLKTVTIFALYSAKRNDG